MSFRNVKPLIACVLDSHRAAPNACAYIRLIFPLTQPALLKHFDVRFVTAAELAFYRPDIVVAQRLAFNTASSVESLTQQCRRFGARLIYEIDDDLLAIDNDHSEYLHYKGAAENIRGLVSSAEEVWVSTSRLAEVFSRLNPMVAVLRNSLDSRVWQLGQAPPEPGKSARILYMGTVSHSDDFASVFLPAYQRLKGELGEKVSATVIGVVPDVGDAHGIRGLPVPPGIATNYPAFARWLQQINRFDVGVAPLTNTSFNHAKSHVKWLEYSALGIATVATGVGEYAQSIVNKKTGWLAPLGAISFHEVLREAVLDLSARRSVVHQAQANARVIMELARADDEPRILRLAHLTGLQVSADLSS